MKRRTASGNTGSSLVIVETMRKPENSVFTLRISIIVMAPTAGADKRCMAKKAEALPTSFTHAAPLSKFMSARENTGQFWV